MAKRDYYEVLGVSKSADTNEIKKAYRKAAIKHHPDKNPGDKESEDKFKEAAEAYDILSNQDKKARYDQFGHQSPGAGGGYGGGSYGGGGFSMDDIFSNFGDIFGGQFGGFGGQNSGSGRAHVNQGSDLRVKVKLTLQEIANGVTKKLKINKMISCDKCGGSGAKDSNSYSTCNTCSGSGHVTQVVNTFFGKTQTTKACPSCHGEGKTITAPCDKCKGNGNIKGEEVVEIKIPAGVGEGIQLSVSGKGNAAYHGGVNGDLLVLIDEERDKFLIRDGNDLIYNLNITIPTALLGDSIEIPLVEGKAKVKIEPGTHSGKVLRLKGKGLPDINGYGRGDILAVIDIAVPSKLTSEEKSLISQLANLPSFKKAESGEKQNIFERMHNFFR